jgi:hypothetical protein
VKKHLTRTTSREVFVTPQRLYAGHPVITQDGDTV